MDDEIGDHRPVGASGLELVDPHPLGIEFGRQGFGQVRLARRRIGKEQARRIQIAGDADEDLVIPLAGRADADRDVLRQVHAATTPDLIGQMVDRHRGLIDIDRAAHVFVKGHDQFVAGAGDALDGLARAGADDQPGPDSRIGQPGHKVIGDDVAGPEFLPRRRGPVLIGRHHQLAAHQRIDVGLGRQRQFGGRAVGVQPVGLALIEADAAVDQRCLNHAVGVAQRIARDRNVGRLTREHRPGLIDRLAAPEDFDDHRIARAGQGAGAEVARDQQGVFIHPGRPALGFLQHEAAVDEGAGGAVELADGHGVLAAVRQGDEAAGLLRRQAGRALVDPVLALGRGQGVEVEDGLPLRGVGAVAVQRRGAPDAAHMGRILPEIVDRAVVVETRRGDAVARLDDLQRLLVQALIARVAAQHAQRMLIVGIDPGHGALALDLFQPDVGVGRVRGGEGTLRQRRIGRGRGLGHGARAKGGGNEKRGKRGGADHGTESPTIGRPAP